MKNRKYYVDGRPVSVGAASFEFFSRSPARWELNQAQFMGCWENCQHSAQVRNCYVDCRLAVTQMENEMKLRFEDQNGKRYAWNCERVDYSRSARPAGCFWTLTTHDDCVRVLAQNWAMTVPRILLIAENYDFKPLQNIS